MKIANWIGGRECGEDVAGWLEKADPHSGRSLSLVADSSAAVACRAVSAAKGAFPLWSALTPVQRGRFLFDLVAAMKGEIDALAACVALETGKPPADAKGEVMGAIAQGEYFASEGTRLHGRTLTSSMPGKSSHTIRQPRGVAGLIVPANTPIANIAWKIFPALICGNTVVLKASEDAPEIALRIAKLSKESGLPDGVLNVVQGRGDPAGKALVADERVSVISFTGSTKAGRWIAENAGRRLARVSLELGGKNPFVVCDDADLDHAVHWAVLSAFSNAGQRCAAGSRLIVFDTVFDEFRDRLLARTAKLKLGIEAGCDLGPVINAAQLARILSSVAAARAAGADVLCGGKRATTLGLQDGFYVEPTIVENAPEAGELSCHEIFGPVATLHRASDVRHALEIANDTDYGLTACIHTRSVDRAMWFAHHVRAGVANVNLGTYGSEPHMPFGGFGWSGNGTREPGVEALDVYSELKNISVLHRENQL